MRAARMLRRQQSGGLVGYSADSGEFAQLNDHGAAVVLPIDDGRRSVRRVQHGGMFPAFGICRVTEHRHHCAGQHFSGIRSGERWVDNYPGAVSNRCHIFRLGEQILGVVSAFMLAKTIRRTKSLREARRWQMQQSLGIVIGGLSPESKLSYDDYKQLKTASA